MPGKGATSARAGQSIGIKLALEPGLTQQAVICPHVFEIFFRDVHQKNKTMNHNFYVIAALVLVLGTPLIAAAGPYAPATRSLSASSPKYSTPACLSNSTIKKAIDRVDPNKGRPPAGNFRPLAKCLILVGKKKARPIIYATKKVKKKTIRDVKTGLKIGQKILGNTGPLHLFLVGNNKDESGPKGYDPDPQSRQLATAYCRSLKAYDLRDDLSGCISDWTKTFRKFDCCGAAHNPAAPFNGIRYQSFYYAGANVYSRQGSDLTKVTLHEYIHTYQNNYTIWGNDIAAENAGRVEDYSPGPVWLEEGVAEYLALRIMYQETNYPSFVSKMKENLESARWIKKTHGLTLKDVATRQGQARVNKICDGCGGRLYYDTAAWAMLYLESLVGEDKLIKKYYPQIPYLGWKRAFKKAFGMSMNKFYAKFNRFMNWSEARQLKLLAAVKKSR